MKIIEKLCENFKRLYYYHLHEFINNYLPYIETIKINIKLKIKEIFDIKPKSMTYLLKILINMQILLL